MARGWIHTVYKNDFWHNEVEGGEHLSSHVRNDQAVASGRAAERVRRTHHVIHNADGTVAERESYGSDLFPARA
jgi:uncharacterized protein DUF2188